MKITTLNDFSKCIHYCAAGGHLWVHDVPTGEHCKWRIVRNTAIEINSTSIQFFVACAQKHD